MLPSPLSDATIAAKRMSEKRRAIMLELTLKVTLGLRCKPYLLTIG